MAASQPAPPKKGKSFSADLWVRLATALLLAPLAIYLLWVGGIPFHLLLLIALGIGVVEWVTLTVPQPLPFIFMLASLSVLPATYLAFFWGGPAVAALLPFPALGLLYLLARRAGSVLPGLAAFGPIYLAASLIALLLLRASADEAVGRAQVFFIIFVVWAVDSGAYFAGRLIGGPKLAPRFSPSKTWAGLGGGMLAAALVGWGWSIHAGASQPLVALPIGALLALVAQAGDIAESALKRRFGVKDSGAIFPGHGGMLDRIDGLLLAVPAFVLFQLTVGYGLRWW